MMRLFFRALAVGAAAFVVFGDVMAASGIPRDNHGTAVIGAFVALAFFNALYVFICWMAWTLTAE